MIRGLFFPKWTVTHWHNHCYGCCWLLFGGLSFSPCGLWLTHITIVMVAAGHWLEACFCPSGLWLTHITIVMVIAGCCLETSVFPYVDCDSLTQPLLWLLLVVVWRPQSLPMWTVTHSHNHYYGCCWLFVGGLSLSPCGLWLTYITIVMVVFGCWLEASVFPNVDCDSLT